MTLTEEDLKIVDEVAKAAFGILLTRTVTVNKLDVDMVTASAATAYACGRAMLVERNKMIEMNKPGV